jgi:cellulose synthase/poly-beta-1,6-N-acetylglucosamine synthase-like glycosyltransferase
MAVTTSGNPQSDQLTNLRPTGGTAEVRAPVQTAPALTVILPCYNEAERLPGTLQTLLAHLPVVPGAAEVLVVDDGSTDATVTVAAAVAAVDGRVRVLSYRPNRGKGSRCGRGCWQPRGSWWSSPTPMAPISRATWTGS